MQEWKDNGFPSVISINPKSPQNFGIIAWPLSKPAKAIVIQFLNQLAKS